MNKMTWWFADVLFNCVIMHVDVCKTAHWQIISLLAIRIFEIHKHISCSPFDVIVSVFLHDSYVVFCTIIVDIKVRSIWIENEHYWQDFIWNCILWHQFKFVWIINWTITTFNVTISTNWKRNGGWITVSIK